MHIAAQIGDEEINGMLLSAKAEANVCTRDLSITPLHLASQVFIPFTSSSLIFWRKEWPCRNCGSSSGQRACRNRSQNIRFWVDFFGKFYFIVVQNSFNTSVTPLLSSLLGGHEDVALEIVSRGADITVARSSDGITALIFALDQKLVRIAEDLISRGANPNQCAYDGTQFFSDVD